MTEIANNELVVKSNGLIEASYRLTLQEQRLILLTASMIKKNDKDFHSYRISIEDFNNTVGVKNQAGYTETRELTKKILSRVLTIKESDGELQINWLSSAKYFDKKGFIEISFDPKLKPYLLVLREKFTQYQLQNVIRLKSSYSIRIYELLKQYEFIGERTFNLEELRRILGIEPEEYELYSNFKNRVLKPSQKEINSKKTDISFEFQEKKKGRKVAEIVFKIRSNRETVKKAESKKPLQQIPLSAEVLPSDDLESLLSLVPVKTTAPIRTLIEKYHSSHGHDYVKRNIEYTNNQIRDKRKYRAYLGKSLANDYALEWVEEKKMISEEESAKAEKRRKEAQEINRRVEEGIKNRATGEEVKEIRKAKSGKKKKRNRL
ncbi:MAG: replication initiation protein [Desulfobacterales bacterium]|nr:replication initiation protein [Desulfobacterales bacterium]